MTGTIEMLCFLLHVITCSLTYFPYFLYEKKRTWGSQNYTRKQIRLDETSFQFPISKQSDLYNAIECARARNKPVRISFQK